MPALQSSCIRRAEYNEHTRELRITFRDSGTYTYYGIPPHTYLGLINSSSPGSYFNDHIRLRG